MLKLSLEGRLYLVEAKLRFIYNNLFFECKRCKEVFVKKDHLEDLHNDYCDKCFHRKF